MLWTVNCHGLTVQMSQNIQNITVTILSNCSFSIGNATEKNCPVIKVHYTKMYKIIIITTAEYYNYAQ